MQKRDRITDSDREVLAGVVQAVLDTIPEHPEMPLRDLAVGPGQQDHHPSGGGTPTG